MGDIHMTERQQQQQDPLYQHHVNSFKQLDSIYRELHQDRISDFDVQQKDQTHTERQEAPVEKKWGKTYVSKLKKEEQSLTASDRERLKAKERLAEIIESDRINLDLRLGGLNSEFKDVLSAITAYTKISANAVEGDYDAEQATLLNAMQVNMRFIITMQIKQHEKGLTAAETGMLNRAIQYERFFSAEHDGNLEIPKDAVVNTTSDDKITCEYQMTDKKRQPLFAHDPCVNDIHQGGLGDCYLLSGLASIVTTQPMQIKECMKDNNDGTVTVRFYKHVNFDTDAMEPIYVRVTKTTPDEFSHDCLWVQMMEKAYAASNIHKKKAPIDSIRRPIDKTYSYVESAIQSIRDDIQRTEASIAAPENQNKAQRWKDIQAKRLVDLRKELEDDIAKFENFKLKKPLSSYKVISGGHSGEFIEELLGEQHKGEKIEYEKDQFSEESVIRRRMKPVSVDAFKIGTKANTELAEQTIRDKYNLTPDSANPDDIADFQAKKNILTRKIQTITTTITQQISDAMADKTQKHTGIKQMTLNFIDERIAMCGMVESESNEMEAAMLELLKAKFSKLLEHIDDEAKTIPLTGNYNEFQAAEFDRIKNALTEGRIVSAATRKFDSEKDGLNGETHSGGLHGTHAYTVLGTETRKISGKDFMFLKVRNPWGHSVEQYTLKSDGSLQEREEDDGNSGIFLCELSRFLNVFNSVWLN